jgi:2-polyprenyl-3-methyl-5-hydroxy-6-metoxy-1,4-benzoquinol methylase
VTELVRLPVALGVREIDTVATEISGTADLGVAWMSEERRMCPAVDRETIERFTERYRVSQSEVTRRIERAVIGGDWGANGYTTVTQADRLGAELELRPGSTLLDLGAGRGWPGLYLASVTGCQVVLADVPLEALVSARLRASSEALSHRASPVCCSARSLSFAPSSFDAVVHTDVLC